MNLNEMAQTPAEIGQGTVGGKAQATPQQQAQFDMLLGRARQVLGESAGQWRDALQQDPVRGTVALGTRTLRFLARESEKAGQPVDPAVLLHVGVQFVKDIAGIANDVGLVPDAQLEPFLQQVMQESIAEYMRMDADEGLVPQPEGVRQGAQPARQPPPAPSPRGGVNLAHMAQQGSMR